ncbi:3D-(3,5/4)-trihydroxycyclohexane-1,2-dione acylhydrolase (decyclizing), partial [Bradyrhizobium brasilense]|nr:3D-(3,5/4)-trihydroxycyclohexane-1,2-dione acylhydrolase (decyclizing) [Bradyrhizobium brasilense]
SQATKELAAFAEAHGIPVVVTQAGKSAIDETHPLALGSVGVTGTSAANAIAEDTDLVIAVGTRCQDFTTGSWALFKNETLAMIGLNIAAYDALKHNSYPLVTDAREGLKALSAGLTGWRAPASLAEKATQEKKIWMEAAAKAMATTNAALPS